jgi:predicted N-acetyltransferase YhbS
VDVLPEYGRKGIGTGRVNAVCRSAREAGFAKVTLSTFRDVPWNAPFYEKCGFRSVDPEVLSPQHVELVALERARGLRTDLRLVMEFDTTAG